MQVTEGIFTLASPAFIKSIDILCRLYRFSAFFFKPSKRIFLCIEIFVDLLFFRGRLFYPPTAA